VCVQIQRFSLYKQIELFQGTQAFMREKIGAAAAGKFFGEGYYVVAMGANDFINNYLTPIFSVPERATTPPAAFIGAMIAKYRQQLTVRASHS